MIEIWRKFVSDWNFSGTDTTTSVDHHQGYHQHQVMVALLTAQQEASLQVKSKLHHSPGRQFVADIKASYWIHDAIVIRFDERANGVNFQHLARDRVCFRGHLTSAWDLPSPPTLTIGKYKLDRQLVTSKLNQLKELLPEITHLWVFLNALVVAHFFRHACTVDITGLRWTDPFLKHHKVHFDVDAISRACDARTGIADITYTIHKLSVGRYCVYTLSVTAAEVNLMQVSLGIYQTLVPAPQPVVHEVDILID